MESGGDCLTLPLEERMAATKSWAAWKAALKDALEKFFAMQDATNLAEVSAGSLEAWKQHYLNHTGLVWQQRVAQDLIEGSPIHRWT